jgi:hypothetical protein
MFFKPFVTYIKSIIITLPKTILMMMPFAIIFYIVAVLFNKTGMLMTVNNPDTMQINSSILVDGVSKIYLWIKSGFSEDAFSKDLLSSLYIIFWPLIITYIQSVSYATYLKKRCLDVILKSDKQNSVYEINETFRNEQLQKLEKGKKIKSEPALREFLNIPERIDLRWGLVLNTPDDKWMIVGTAIKFVEEKKSVDSKSWLRLRKSDRLELQETFTEFATWFLEERVCIDLLHSTKMSAWVVADKKIFKYVAEHLLQQLIYSLLSFTVLYYFLIPKGLDSVQSIFVSLFFATLLYIPVSLCLTFMLEHLVFSSRKRFMARTSRDYDNFFGKNV